MLEAFHSQGLEAEQASREKQQIEAARAAAAAAHSRLVAQNRESATEHGREAFARYGEAVRLGLDALLTRFCRDQSIAGPHFEALPLLLHWSGKGLEPIAAIALGAVIDSMTTKRSRRELVNEIGRRVEAEVLAMRVERRGADLLRLMKKRSGGRRGAVIGRDAMDSVGVNPERWTAGDRRAVGGLLLDLVVHETGLVVIRRGSGSRATVEPSDDGLALARLYPPRPLRARRLPMLTEPRPWTGLYGGGHFSNQASLVTCRSRRDLAYLAGANLAPVLEVVNTLQAQRMRVDPWMVKTQRQAWEAGIRGLFPVSREPVAEPPRPEHGADRRSWARWQEQAVAAWRDERGGRPMRVRIERTLRELEEVAGRTVWFAYDLDFRGRIYTCNRYATHQGPDWEKAAISVEGKRCGEAAAEWMLMAAAGHWGLSRARWEERLAWGRANVDRLTAVAQKPLDRVELWREAKDPWQFLQMARAFTSWLEDPTQPVGAPVRLDQTTSGLGILAALVRHRGIAEATNIIGEGPSDLYAAMAEQVTGMLRIDLEAGDPHCQRQAAFWLERGVNRQLAKGPVMTVAYGARYPTLVDRLVDLLLEQDGSIQACAYEEQLLKPARYMATRLVKAMRQRLQPCLLVGEWLRMISGTLVKRQIPVQWTSPMGLPIRLGTPAPAQSKVSTLLHGAARWQTLMDRPSAGELSARETSRSAAANLVHSFDAAFAQVIVCRCASQSVQVLTNHDCFAACPADAELLHRTLHDELRVMYQVDWLEQIRAEILQQTGGSCRLPPPPMVDDLCPGEIGQNPYAFS
ncbi:MAG: DNA-directed RNA polymerase [Synechococcaceae cyanobacterium]|nr:DNA-directed RNA polymerase [Synechococcaceae cyanobacterium]